MKKILGLVFAVVYMLSLVACTRPTLIVSSVPESIVEEESTVASILNGQTYTLGGAIEFTVDESWIVNQTNPRMTSIRFANNTNTLAGINTPARVDYAIELSKEACEILMQDFASGYGGVETIRECTQTVVDNRDVWVINADIDKNGEIFKTILWVAQSDDGKIVFAWAYMSVEAEYDTYLPQMQALVDSIRFI